MCLVIVLTVAVAESSSRSVPKVKEGSKFEFGFPQTSCLSPEGAPSSRLLRPRLDSAASGSLQGATCSVSASSWQLVVTRPKRPGGQQMHNAGEMSVSGVKCRQGPSA